MAMSEQAVRPIASGEVRALAERIFFLTIAVYCTATILGGFTSTFFMRGTFLPGAAPLRAIVVVHGVLFTTWVLLFLTQTVLIAAGRRELHKRLGLAAVAVIAALAATGVALIAGFERGHGLEPPLTLAVHLFANVAPLTLFVGFAAAGVLWRRRSDVHKRLMLLAVLALQPAGFARLLTWLGLGQGPNIPMYALLCAAIPVYDLAVDRRLRAVSIVGSALLFGEVYVTDVLFTYIQS
jgi:hypothetical protein